MNEGSVPDSQLISVSSRAGKVRLSRTQLAVDIQLALSPHKNLSVGYRGSAETDTSPDPSRPGDISES